MSVVEVAAFMAGNVTKSAEQVTAGTLMEESIVRKGVCYPKMIADLKRGDMRCVKMCLFSMGCETTTIFLVQKPSFPGKIPLKLNLEGSSRGIEKIRDACRRPRSIRLSERIIPYKPNYQFNLFFNYCVTYNKIINY